MNQDNDIQHKFSQGEGLYVEFKTSFTIEVISTLVAFSNAKGGSVYIGISDKHDIKGVIIGKETIAEWLNDIKNKTTPTLIPDVYTYTYHDKTIVALTVAEYPLKPVSIKGRCYKRVENSNQLLKTAEVANMHLQSLNSSWDAFPSVYQSTEHIDFDKVNNAIQRLNQKGRNITEGNELFLKKYSLLTQSSTLTNAAYLLFKNQDGFMTTIELGRFQTPTIIKDAIRSKSDLITQVDQVMAFILKHINKAINYLLHNFQFSRVDFALQYFCKTVNSIRSPTKSPMTL